MDENSQDTKTNNDLSTHLDNMSNQSPRNSNFFKIGFFILAAVLLVGSGITAGWYFFSYAPNMPNASPTPTPLITQPVIRISPTEMLRISPQASVTGEINPTEDPLSDLEKIRKAMALKHDKAVADTIITIGENTGTHVRGGVKFAGEIAGAWFLAAKRDSEWVIVQDGNGTMTCEIVEPWDFPVSQVPECVDEDGNLKTF